MNMRFYLLKIQLLHIEPAIWRRFVVPGNITLDRLHDVIQIIMGWKDYHLFQFSIGKKRYTEDPESKEDGLEVEMFRLVDLIKKKGRTFQYIYDFGDGWDHEITVENSNFKIDQLQTLVECIEGQRACPPEDVGSIPGYYNFCEVLNNKKHEDHESCKNWYESNPFYHGKFDSEAFDTTKVNTEIMKYLRWSRDREQMWFDYDNIK